MDFKPERYEKMPYRKVGRSGLKLPLISLGFWQSLGKEGNEKLCKEIAFQAFNSGITHFDFANNYGPPPGHSEEVMGKVLKEMPRDELIISSKAGFRMWDGPYQIGGSRKYLMSSLHASLKRLQLDYLDIFYHHCFDHETPLEETLTTLDLMVKQGKALYIGLSNYSGEQLREAINHIHYMKLERILIVQPHMNMLERTNEFGLLPVASEHEIGVIPFCPLAQGALTDKYLDGPPENARHGDDDWYREKESEGAWDKVRQLKTIADRRGQKVHHLALQWLLSRPQVASVVMGVSRAQQLEDNLKIIDMTPLTQDELNGINQIL